MKHKSMILIPLKGKLMQTINYFLLSVILIIELLFSMCSLNKGNGSNALVIQEQGSFAVGGTSAANPGTFNPYKPTPDGQTLRGDHAYVFYQKPVNARKYPLVFLHGHAESSKTWETTPDGREGFQNIFLRRGFSVYLLDQPRRGRAGRSTVSANLSAAPDEQFLFGIFRIGIWPEYFPGVQFSKDTEALNQFYRQVTPNTGPYDPEVISDSISALFDKTGEAVLITHSQGGGPGWLIAMKNKNVKAVISYEPGSGFVFPEGEVPPAMPSSAGPLTGTSIALSEFNKLTKIPIVIYYGDNIPDAPTENPGQDNWRVRLVMAGLWAEAVNRRGGDVKIVHLPKIGVKGNTHFPFSDLNNAEIADLMSNFLHEKKLDK